MPRLETISFDKSTIETAYRFIADVCGQSIGTVALDEVQQYPEILLWLKQGHEYHEAHGIADCLLCGNAISAERRAHLTAALDDSVDQFVARLNRTAQRLAGLIESSTQMGAQIPALDDLASEFRIGFREVRDNLLEDVRLLAKQLGTLQAVLFTKLERPATPAGMKDVAAEADVVATAERIDAGVVTVNETILAHNQAVTNFAVHKEAAEASIRRHFIIDCRDDYAKTAKDLNDATNQHEIDAKNATALRDMADELRQQIRTHGPAAGVINRLIAAYLGHGELTINPIDDGYELQRHGTPITGVPTKARLRDLNEAGFGIAELVLIDTPKDWPQSGFQLVAALLRKGHSGGWSVTRLAG